MQCHYCLHCGYASWSKRYGDCFINIPPKYTKNSTFKIWIKYINILVPENIYLQGSVGILSSSIHQHSLGQGSKDSAIVRRKELLDWEMDVSGRSEMVVDFSGRVDQGHMKKLGNGWSGEHEKIPILSPNLLQCFSSSTPLKTQPSTTLSLEQIKAPFPHQDQGRNDGGRMWWEREWRRRSITNYGQWLVKVNS